MSVVRSSPTRLTFRTLGGFSVEEANGQVLPLRNRKAGGLLAYLALSRNAVETRERLAGLFWSDRSEDQARASLRQCLRHLRTTFDEIGFPGLQADRQDIKLSADRVSLDLAEIEAELGEGRVPETLLDASVHPDRILEGYESLDQSFATWLYVVRQNWRNQLVDSLALLIARAGDDRALLRRAAEAKLVIDPTDEEANRILIRLQADAGNVPGALRIYGKLWDVLDEEYDMEPSDETQALIAEIKSGSYVPAPLPAATGTQAAVATVVAAPAPPSRLPVIAISRFLQGGRWKEQKYLIDGFRRELIASLVRFREWSVVEAGQDAGDLLSGPLELAAAPTDYKVEGSCIEGEESVRLIVTLKESASGRYIWSETVTLDLDNWFNAQRDIVGRISTALNIYVSKEKLTRLTAQAMGSLPLGSLDFYDRWLYAQELVLQWRTEAHRQASEIFWSVVRDAPTFSRGYASLAQLGNNAALVSPGVHRLPERQRQTLDFARQAVQIDPLDARAQQTLAWAYAMNGQYDHAEINFSLACDLNQNDPWTMVSASLGLGFCDRLDSARALSRKAFSLGFAASQSHWGYNAVLRFLDGDYDGCVAAAERAEAVLFNLPAWKAAALHHLGRQAEAEREARRFVELTRGHWAAPQPPSEPAIAHWLLQSFPIRNAATWRRLRDGVAGAGIEMPDWLAACASLGSYSPHSEKE